MTLYLKLDPDIYSKLKKYCIWFLVAAVLVIFAETSAGAADTVGIVNSQKILFQHPQFDQTTRLLLFLSRPITDDPARIVSDEKDPEMKRLLTQSLNLIKEFAELDRNLTTEKDTGGKQRAVIARQARLSEERQRRMAPILEDCNKALRSIMTQKKMTVILEADSVYLGGTDITEDVIARLKGTKK
ncbi:MAG: OmpH family outer membrane protein [Synergistaceae bacterium]|nr:OmpH family outer membrane protein [Synergistaceae bacterium]